MFTPREIRDIDFESASRGYRPDDVNGFLDRIADQMEALLSEKDELQAKMMMLAERVEQYRSEEDALKAALISAERMKDNILAEAQQQKEIVVRDAQQKADRILSEAQQSITREEVTLKALKQQVAAFKSEVLNIYKTHLEVLSDLPDEPADPDFDEAAVSELFTEQPVQQYAEPQQEAPAAAAEQPVFFEPQPASEPQFATAEPAAPVYEAQPATQQPAYAPVADGTQTYEGFAPRAAEENRLESQPAASNEPVFASFGTEEPAPQRTEESRFEKLDFGENFSFGRD